MRSQTTRKRNKHEERTFQLQVIDLAHVYGWKAAAIRTVLVKRPDESCYHETPMGADGKGWLDLFLVNPTGAPGRIWRCCAELKLADKHPQPDQKLWLQWHEKTGTPSFVWRPVDLNGEIMSVLRDGIEIT